mmetsp:Transcript_28567/g.35340  ORF Transcript_28567/g.35340 Transcript_28567/m.35340 type:complete len:234 (+) Transcript_28567:196-897(+)
MSVGDGSTLVLSGIPSLLQGANSIDKLLPVLLDVLPDDLVNFILGPEANPLLANRVSGFLDLLVFHAGRPVELVHGLRRLEVLAPGDLVVGVQCFDSGVHQVEFDVVRSDTLHGILSEVEAPHGVEAVRLESDQILTTALSLYLRGLDRWHGVPLGSAHEEAVEAAIAPPGSAVEAELPLHADEGHLGHGAERVHLEVVVDGAEGILLLEEASPPGLNLGASNLELADVVASL